MDLTRRFQIFNLMCVIFVCHVSTQLPPSFGNNPRPLATSSPNCNYLLSAGTPGSCVITTVDVERKLDLLKDSMARERLQFVSHNSLVQQQIADLQNRDKQFSLQIDGLRRDLLALSARGVSSGVPSTGVTNVNLQQLQAALTRAINNVDNKLTNLTAVYQRDAVSQSRVNSALQSQLTQVNRENQLLKATTSSLSLQLQQLATQLRSVAAKQATMVPVGPQPPATNPPTTPTTTTTTTTTATTPTTAAQSAGPTVNPAVINSILQQIQTLTTANNKNAADITKLNNLQAAVTNNTNGVINTNAALRAFGATLKNTTVKADGVYNWLQNVFPGVQTDINNLKSFSSNLSQTQKSLQATVLGLIGGQARQDQAINELAKGITSYLGTTVQTRNQLTSMQQKIRNILNPIITPPLTLKTTPAASGPVPPTLRPRPGK